MGNALGVTGLSVLATIAFVVAAILSIVADSKLKGIPTYNTNNDLKAAHNDLTIAIVLGWIAAGLAFILMLGYLLTSLKVLQNEWLHFILWILGIAAAVIAIIYLGLAMKKVDNITNDNSTKTYILWSMILSGVGLVLLVFLGMWRMTHHVTKAPEVKTTGSSYLVSSQGMSTTSDDDIPPPVMGYPAEKPDMV